MIDIGITIDDDGNLGGLKAEGHSLTAEKGSNIVCAAVSAVLRAAVRALSARAGLDVAVKADTPGYLELFVEKTEGGDSWLMGVTDILLAGLLEVERDYPDECRIVLHQK